MYVFNFRTEILFNFSNKCNKVSAQLVKEVAAM